MAAGIEALETQLSKFSNSSNRLGDFLVYLKEKRVFDGKADRFYLHEKWRGWKFKTK